jgi:hypothetical protein
MRWQLQLILVYICFLLYFFISETWKSNFNVRLQLPAGERNRTKERTNERTMIGWLAYANVGCWWGLLMWVADEGCWWGLLMRAADVGCWWGLLMRAADEGCWCGTADVGLLMWAADVGSLVRADSFELLKIYEHDRAAGCGGYSISRVTVLSTTLGLA